jgi:hypothetical protein
MNEEKVFCPMSAEIVSCFCLPPSYFQSGGLPRIRTEFSPVKSRDFTIKVCNPIATRRRS